MTAASRSLDVVTHVFAGVHAHYASALKLQFASLVEHVPETASVQLIVACASAKHDQATWDAICELLPRQRKNVCIETVELDRAELFRRAIFRHRWSQQSKADVIWFADADYVIGGGSIEAILGQVNSQDRLCFPRHYWIHRDHETGDRALAGGSFDKTEFFQRESKLAIGGMQIIGSACARSVGYLGDESKWQRPSNPEIPFGCFRDDSTWRRKEFPGGGRPIDVPNIFRIRHSVGAKGSPGPVTK